MAPTKQCCATGDRGGYHRHVKRHETPCPAAKQAQRDYMREYMRLQRAAQRRAAR